MWCDGGYKSNQKALQLFRLARFSRRCFTNTLVTNLEAARQGFIVSRPSAIVITSLYNSFESD